MRSLASRAGRTTARRGKCGKPGAPAEVAPALTPAMKRGLALLLQAHETAGRLERDPWDFALEIQALKEAGLNQNDLRSLVCQGLTDHQLERTLPRARRRTFCAARGLRLHESSCFRLSAAGLRVARRVLAGAALVGRAAEQGQGEAGTVEIVRHGAAPVWDRNRRELRLGDVIVKRFRQPARNQETILAAFQEDGWAARVDNPLADNGNTDALDRLHDAVKMLNRHTQHVLRFHSDGLGAGVFWDLVCASVPGAS